MISSHAPSLAPVLSVRDLSVDYKTGGTLKRAVSGLSFDIMPGETVALVGESGCGKSTTAMALARLLPETAVLRGSATVAEGDLLAMSETELRHVRGSQIGIVFQEPLTALNPVYRIGAQIAEVIAAHERLSAETRRARVRALMTQVGLPDVDRLIDAYPHELSGGQRQRVVIAMAIAQNPKLLIADEPTTALDVTTQATILDLLAELQERLGMAMLLISHDLAVVTAVADRVIVMHHGEQIEALPSKTLETDAQHPYTLGLLGASLAADDTRHYRSVTLSEIKATRAADGQWSYDLHRPPMPAVSSPSAALLIEAKDIRVEYHDGERNVIAVDGVSFHIGAGETLGLVGESGCGKSSLSRALMRLTEPQSGSLLMGDDNILTLRGRELRAWRASVQMIFQDPFASLNPRISVGGMLLAILRRHGRADGREAQTLIEESLSRVGLPVDAAACLPHEFSGGQRQRIGIARALILKPKLVICDEAVSALDVSVQAQVLNLFNSLKADLGLSYLFISHDLGVIRYMSDRVIVMRDGKFVEEGVPDQLWATPRHPYTTSLIASSILTNSSKRAN